MTKLDLQQELLEKVKPGTKPSQLKKSRSLSDIPQAPLPKNLTKSKSAEELKPVKSLEIEQLEAKISVLELKLETNQRELSELNSLTAENNHLKEQVKIKQQQMESLRKELEETNSKLTQTQQELDKSLAARHQGLKDWNQVYQKAQALDSELNNTVEESAEELTSQDQLLTKLRSENFKLKQTNQSLQRNLNLTSRLAESRKVPYYEPERLSYFKYVVYGLLTVGFMLFLISKRSDHD